MRAPQSAAVLIRSLAVAVVVVGTGLATTGPAAAAPSATVDYVALGDSYASGVGSGPETGECRVTEYAYPALWAATEPTAVKLTQKACSGASSADVLADLVRTPDATNPVKALDAGTDLVSLTVGANDLNLVDALKTCADTSQAQACATKLAAAEAALTTTFPEDLGKTLAAVKTNAPKARIAVVGYPLPFEDVAQCALPLPKTLRDAGNTAVAGINRVLEAQAAAAGATFVDVAARYAGHGLCGTEPWIVGLAGLANNTLLHPSRLGQERGQLIAFTEKVGTPEEILAWIADRDKPAPVPSATPTPTPTTTGPAAPDTAGGTGAGDSGSASGGLPVTGTNVWMLAGVGLALLVAGAFALRVRRPRRVRVVSE
ncbi:SGNH/GDSL hydrolase family protein [Jidongwangia harbinensis]|uniref:SGNH/GDSL hydrolase family protein n=1 Tax=Jidongwangia harbinensis TaxID=2878561 RepID=UPI001CD9CEE1|nr:SGNH/GDSL hydrolase family protein [Jidongwangia harbinensis]MCA2211907.1 SGNH/GDSL hydrolase family protein [Jidongwangia harbinensis]